MKKSILALLLAVLMVASLLPAAALAVGPTENYVAAYTNSQNVTTYYATVGAALSASNAGGGGTIELLKNAELKASDTTSDSDKKEYPRFGWCVYVRANLILDLGDNTLTCGEFFGLAVNPNVQFTLQNGTYKHSSTGWCTAIEGTKSEDDGPGCTITIASNAIVETNGDAVVCDGYTTVYVYGKIYSEKNGIYGMGPNNIVNVNGAYISSGLNAICQDEYQTTNNFYRNGSVYNIEDSELISSGSDAICIENNTSANCSSHELNIKNSTVSGENGISMSRTNATISGERTQISGTDNSVFVTYLGADGTTGSLIINAGEIVGPIGVRDPGSAGNAATISISGGEFDRPVNPDYLAEGYIYELCSDGVYTYYMTMEDALAAAEPGTIITDLDSNTDMEVFAVTVEPNNGQTATTTLVQDGGTYFIPAAPTRSGYAFLGWSDGAETYKPGDEYTVTKDTTITALWKEEYNVVYIYNNGAATGHETVLKGESVNLPTPSKSGYAFLGWACSDGNVYDGGDKVAIWGNTTFEATWVRHPDTPYVPEPEEPVTPDVPTFPFYDVSTSAWYYSAVKYVYENGLMDGVDTYVFAPNDTLTRAMVWTIIARMSGVDTTGGNSWYAKAQEWVITNGISDGENPTAAITRQELVTMLYRYAQIKGYDVSVGESTNILSYVDATSISEYAMSAFQWACGSGLTEGDENGALTPLATATRAQAAAMIMRFCESVK